MFFWRVDLVTEMIARKDYKLQRKTNTLSPSANLLKGVFSPITRSRYPSFITKAFSSTFETSICTTLRLREKKKRQGPTNIVYHSIIGDVPRAIKMAEKEASPNIPFLQNRFWVWSKRDRQKHKNGKMSVLLRGYLFLCFVRFLNY